MRSFAIATLLSAACAVNAAIVAVSVGTTSGQLIFSPSTVNAVEGDTISFTFLNGPHTVTQSDPSSTCKDLSGGFDSGQHSANFVYVHTATTAGTFPFHCDFGNHCQKGMTGTLIVAASSSSSTTAANSSASASSSSTASANGLSSATGTTLSGASGAAGTSTATSSAASNSATSSSAARQFGGGSVLGAAMALFVGLAL